MYLKLRTAITSNAKIQRLTFAERWAYVAVLVAAKGEDPEGEFVSRAQFDAAVGPEIAPYHDRLLEELLVQDAPDGRVVLPTWKHWQARDYVPADKLESKQLAERREYERARKANQRANKANVPRDMSPNVPDIEREKERNSFSLLGDNGDTSPRGSAPRVPTTRKRDDDSCPEHGYLWVGSPHRYCREPTCQRTPSK